VNHRYLAAVFTGKASRSESTAWVSPDGTVTPITTMTRKALELCAKRESVVQIRPQANLLAKNGVI